MKIHVQISGFDFEREAIKKAEEYFKQGGLKEELWSAVHETSPFKEPIEGPIGVATTIVTPTNLRG